jgi:hypothetical protein
MFYESHLSVTRTIGKLEIAIGGFGKNTVSKFLLFVNFRGSNSAEGDTYQLADMYRRGPNPLADMDRGVHIRGESKSTVTPDSA